MDEREIVYEEVGNYTKYALVEMLINKHKKSFNNLNQIEKLADDIINVLDLIMLINFVLNDNPTNSEFNASDLNNDGIGNILDVVLLVNIILGS